MWTAAAAAPAVAAGFYLLAAVRSKRSLHPTGVGYRGWLVIGDDHPGRPEAPLFRPGTTHPALLRFSRGAGLPEPLPDALGVAVKLPSAYGPGKDQDLLLTSSSDRPLLRRLLFPATSFVRGVFSTALPYELGGKRVVLLLVPAHTDGAKQPMPYAAVVLAPLPSWTPPPPGAPLRAPDRQLLRAFPAGSDPDHRPAAVARADRSPAVQPMDHRTGDSTSRLAQPPARHRLQSKPTRPAVLTIALRNAHLPVAAPRLGSHARPAGGILT